MNKIMRRGKVLLLNFYASFAWRMLIGSYLLAIVGGLGLTLWQNIGLQKGLIAELGNKQLEISGMQGENRTVKEKLDELQNTDERVRNEMLVASMAAMKSTFTTASELFEKRADLGKQGIKTEAIDKDLALFLDYLAKDNVASAASVAKNVSSTMEKLLAAQVASVSTPKLAPTSNTVPSGTNFVRQSVNTSRGTFVISMVVAEGARVVVDTAAESDCGDNCPALPLADYVARNGGFAGINGSYFCPPDYARCAGKTNSYDTLVFNGRTKKAFNQSNNVYSVVPLMAAYGGSLNFYRRTLDWGVDSGATGAIANHPLLLQSGSIAFDEGSLEAYQRDGRGVKGFVGTKGNQIIIGHVYGATVPEEAEVLKTLCLDNALNLDGGGSSALWYGGYKVGPGRLLPTAIVLVR